MYHDDGFVASKVSYDSACRPLLCKNTDEYKRAEPPAIAFSMAFADAKTTEVFLFQGENIDGYAMSLQMVGQRIHAPNRTGQKEFVFLELEPFGTTCLVDIESGVNFPWQLRFRYTQCPHSQRMSFVFKWDVSVFMDLLRGTENLDIRAVRCQASPVSYSSMDVISLDKAVMVQDDILADMDDIEEKETGAPAAKGAADADGWSWEQELAGLGDH